MPAIFCASATLIQRHEERRKRGAGKRGERRGKEAAAVDAAGAALGGVGLSVFAVVFVAFADRSPAIALVYASAGWLLASMVAWWIRRKLPSAWHACVSHRALKTPLSRHQLACLPAGDEFGTFRQQGWLSVPNQGSMPMATKEKDLNELFLDTLKDIYYAEKQILKALPKMAKAATSEELQAAFEKHHEETEGHLERLDQIFELLGKPARGKKCDAIEGIIEEGKEIMEEYADTPAAGGSAGRRALRDLALRHVEGMGHEARARGCGQAPRSDLVRGKEDGRDPDQDCGKGRQLPGRGVTDPVLLHMRLAAAPAAVGGLRLLLRKRCRSLVAGGRTNFVRLEIFRVDGQEPHGLT
jgi:hypothetical protein